MNGWMDRESGVDEAGAEGGPPAGEEDAIVSAAAGDAEKTRYDPPPSMSPVEHLVIDPRRYTVAVAPTAPRVAPIANLVMHPQRYAAPRRAKHEADTIVAANPVVLCSMFTPGAATENHRFAPVGDARAGPIGHSAVGRPAYSGVDLRHASPIPFLPFSDRCDATELVQFVHAVNKAPGQIRAAGDQARDRRWTCGWIDLLEQHGLTSNKRAAPQGDKFVSEAFGEGANREAGGAERSAVLDHVVRVLTPRLSTASDTEVQQQPTNLVVRIGKPFVE